MGVKARWGPSGLGILTSGTMSLSRWDPDTDSSGLNPRGGSGNLCKAQDPVIIPCSPVEFSSSGACYTEPLATWGTSRSVASSKGIGDGVDSLSVGLRGISKISSSLKSILWAMHLWRSWAAPHIMMPGPPDHLVQYCRTLARARVCTPLFSWMSHMPWKPIYGNKSLQPRALRLDGGFHQPDSSSLAAACLKFTACLLASSFTFVSPSPPVHPW